MAEKVTVTSQDIATVNASALAPAPTLADLGSITGVADRPTSIDPLDNAGKEDFRDDEIQLPRVTVAQGLHPQLVPSESKYIPGLAIGMMFNDVTEEIYGTGPITVVPIYRHITRIEFDKNDRNVVVDRDVPVGDARLQWSRGTGPDGEDEPPAATEFVEFVSLILRPGKEPDKAVVSIKTTNKEMRNAARLWTTYIDQRKGPIYSGLYRVSSTMVKGKNKKGQDTLYGVFVVKNAGYIPKDTPAGALLFEYAKSFHDAAQGKRIETAREGGDDTNFDTDVYDAEGKM